MAHPVERVVEVEALVAREQVRVAEQKAPAQTEVETAATGFAVWELQVVAAWAVAAKVVVAKGLVIRKARVEAVVGNPAASQAQMAELRAVVALEVVDLAAA